MTRPLLFELRAQLRVALERCSLLEELGATHKEVSLISHPVISVKGLSFESFHLKKNEGCSGGHQMFFLFQIEDLPTWVILVSSEPRSPALQADALPSEPPGKLSKLALWLRAAGCLQYPFVLEMTNSDSNHLVVFGMDSINMYFLFMLCFQFRVEFFQVEFRCLYLYV